MYILAPISRSSSDEFFEDIGRERMEVAILRHQYDLIDLAVHFIRRKRIGKRTCPSKTMDRKATTVWPLRPASGGAPKRGSKILQERHAYAHRDIR